MELTMERGGNVAARTEGRIKKAPAGMGGAFSWSGRTA
jgi:hypothetical protein